MARLNPQALARLVAVLQEHIARQHIPGAVAVVAQGGEVQLFEALGRRDPAAGDAMARDAIFRIYSMTKPIVSLAALMLAEQGRLQLTDPVSRYLPGFAKQQVAVQEGAAVRLEPVRREATLHDLLRHTAGLSYEFLGDGPVQQQYRAASIGARDRSNAQAARDLAALPLAHQPGSCWHYSRATDVLGAVLEVVSGKTLGALLQDGILGPLGMADTVFGLPPDKASRLAEPFATCPDSGAPVRLLQAVGLPAFESGGGGLLSTAGDYIRFLQLLRGRGRIDGVRLVSSSTVDWMASDHLGAIPVAGDLLPPGHGFGLGLAVRLTDGLSPQPGSAGQYFWSGIGGTSFFVDPAQDVFAMLLTQAPHQRIYYRNLWRHLVYAALE